MRDAFSFGRMRILIERPKQSRVEYMFFFIQSAAAPVAHAQHNNAETVLCFPFDGTAGQEKDRRCYRRESTAFHSN